METIAQVLHTPYPCYSETTEDKLLFMELHFEDINDELRENAMTLIMVTWLVCARHSQGSRVAIWRSAWMGLPKRVLIPEAHPSVPTIQVQSLYARETTRKTKDQHENMMLDSLAVTNTPGKYQMTVAISSWQVPDLLNLMRTFERLDKDE
ncbi:hypothetical protein BGZ59_000707 [Podila verticillata]|nr:hypothetical protein BGZ59_000707 [Podila verticillata]